MSTRAAIALIGAGARHRRELAAPVDAGLERWRKHAAAIPDDGPRALALGQLQGDAGHARAATMLATLAPHELRVGLARTILATELLYDHLDSRTELLVDEDPLSEARRLYTVFADACAMRRPYVPEAAGDHRYLSELANATRDGLAALPGAPLVRDHLVRVAARAAEAQVRLHASATLGLGQLEEWARSEAAGAELGWREHLAGCGASVLCVHALAVRGACPAGATPEGIDRAYLHLAALATLLDGLVDGDDRQADGLSYTATYDSEAELCEAVLAVAGSARALLGKLGPRHEMMLAGVVAHYASLPGARGPSAARAFGALRAGNRAAIALASLALRRPGTRPHRSGTTAPLQPRPSDELVRG